MIHLCCCSTEIAIDNTKINECGCAPIDFYVQKKGVGWIWYMKPQIANIGSIIFLKVEDQIPLQLPFIPRNCRLFNNTDYICIMC